MLKVEQGGGRAEIHFTEVLMKKRFMLILSILLFSFIAYANSSYAKDISKLRKECGENAREYFQVYSAANTDKDVSPQWDFRNHYNVKMDKCFILISKFTPLYLNKIVEEHYIVDLGDNSTYAAFMKVSDEPEARICKGWEIGKCASFEEWLDLIGHYLAE